MEGEGTKNLLAFLKPYYYKKEENKKITHTRIGDKKKITGGAWSIPDNKLDAN